MPFFFRKTIKAGPFNFNFSKGGVGASVGIKGLRIGTGPRGHYVHAGSGGFYYRATIGRPGDKEHGSDQIPLTPSPHTPPSDYEGGVHMMEIDSGDVMAMRDENFADVIDEINAKRRKTSMAFVLALACGAAGLITINFLGDVGLVVAFAMGAIGWFFGAWLDTYRRTCVLFYELDPPVEHAYQEMVGCFDRLAACSGQWHVEAGGAVQDLTTWKRNAGATHVVRKKATTLTFKLPKAVTSNVTPPALHVGKQVIYFLPDALLIDDGTSVGAVAYSQLSVTWQDSNFIETGVVPSDAQVIGQTWQHPNKNGGPDRRFRDNRQIPICRYEAMLLRSPSGVNELVEFSKTGVAAPFAAALRSMPKNAISTSQLILGE